MIAKFIEWFRHRRCEHEWELTYVHRTTMEPKERRCTKCGITQYAITVWVDACAK